jgi:hypothetical protein
MNRTRPLHLVALVLGCYLVGRALAEPFVVDVGSPHTYRHDWGGPSLAGVLAVHCGPGLLVLGYAARRLASRRSLTREPQR